MLVIWVGFLEGKTNAFTTIDELPPSSDVGGRMQFTKSWPKFSSVKRFRK